ncbi:MAG TPA: ABC transporter permease [Candidatus Acidoferrales bacterium]|nr:ABC transporter permease [Candidatus Acidoferrales bacterium]
MLDDLWIRLRALVRRRTVEHELDQELRFHFERQVEKYVQAGLPPAEARRRARLEFGGLEQVKEECRQARGVHFVQTLWQDIHYGLRMMGKNPGFTAVAVLTLALGIGATTAFFSVVNGVLLNPLPFPHPSQLVDLYSRDQTFTAGPISYPNFLDWQAQNHSFSAMAAVLGSGYDLTGLGEPERIQGQMVSAAFFSLLGLRPVIGRTFLPEEDRVGAAPVALVSERLWQRKLGGSPEVVGKTLTLNGRGYTILGVVPDRSLRQIGMSSSMSGNVYVPIGQWNDPAFRDRRTELGTYAIGRLKPGVALAQAKADMDAVAGRLAAAYPAADKDAGIALVTLKEDGVGHVRPLLLMLLAAVGFVLLIACANVASLLLARSTDRAREFAVRAALGASQARVVRQLLTENMLLSVAGGALGLLLAAWGTQAALKALPQALPRAGEVHVDGRVLLFTLAASLLAGILFGLAPALPTSRPDLQEVLKEGGRGASDARHGAQSFLVVVEMALTIILLTGAGLMVRSMAKLAGVDPGFDPGHVLNFGVSFPASAVATPNAARATISLLYDAVAAVPGVRAASLVTGTVPLRNYNEMPLWLEGQPKPARISDMKVALLSWVQPDYLKVMKIPLERGRFLSAQDNEHSPYVIVIDDRFARQYFGGRNPIGKHVNFAVFDDVIPAEIVGVVGHVKQWGLASDAQSPVQAQCYSPISQIPDRFTPLLADALQFEVRTNGPPMAEIGAIRHAIENVGVAYNAATLDAILSSSLGRRRFSMVLLGIFAGLGLLLSCVGAYGVISFFAGRRRHEIGIRMALGAQRSHVLQLIVARGARLALAGVAMGVLAALGLMRFLSSQLFGVTATDPLTIFAVSGLLLLVALAACYIPARRAMRVDPMGALRHE